MLKSEKKVYDRILSWSNWDVYFNDVYRTLVQTGIVFVCRDDIFEVKQRLERLGISLDSLNIVSNYGGYFITMRTHNSGKKRGNTHNNPKILKLQNYNNKH